MLPIKRKNPVYYEKIKDPIDLAMIEQNIVKGAYRHPEQFNEDVLKLVNNAIRFYGRLSDLGICAVRLLKIFTLAKHTNMVQFEEIIGEKLPKTFFGKYKSGNVFVIILSKKPCKKSILNSFLKFASI